jgi:hypothetical protein
MARHCTAYYKQWVLSTTHLISTKFDTSDGTAERDRTRGNALRRLQNDSGGPVYRNKDATHVYAVGMIQAVQKNTTAPCGATRAGATYCSYRVLYTSINAIIRAVPGSSVVTG